MKNSKHGLIIYSFFTVLFLSGCSDLVVKDVRYTSFIGSSLQVKVKVKNEGWTSAADTTTQVEIKPVGSSTFTRNLIRTTPTLASGQQVEVSLAPLYPHEVPTQGSGQCIELRACADIEDVVSESSEGNNCKAESICR